MSSCVIIVSEMDESDSRSEFPVQDRSAAAVVGPSIGVGMIAFIGAGAVFMVLAAGASLFVDVSEGFVMAMGPLLGTGAGIWAATRFVRWRRRVNDERKIVVDREGITYFKYRDRKELIRWDEIERVEERRTLDAEREYTYTLHIHRKLKDPFRIAWDEFGGYDRMKAAIRRRLPDRSTLL